MNSGTVLAEDDGLTSLTNDARVMPPASANRTLTPTEKETLRRWIAEGARY